MSANNTTDGSRTDGLQKLLRAYAEAVYNDPPERVDPMATTDADEVIRSQLTENTGTHFLDSGCAGGRHWEENQDNPPWEQPAWDVGGRKDDPHDGYVTHNVYHWMQRTFSRDRTCVALETALYAYGRHGPGEGDGWNTCAEGFANSLLDGTAHREDLSELGLPDELVEDVLGFQHELQPDRQKFGCDRRRTPLFGGNTYNQEDHTLSQCLSMTAFGGPHADYGVVRVHQGADVRGGYTGPRVYRNHYGTWAPMELEFTCEHCEWVDYESVLYGDESVVYQREVDAPRLEEWGIIEEGEADGHPAVETARDADNVSGAVFHQCHDGDGLGYVRVH